MCYRAWRQGKGEIISAGRSRLKPESMTLPKRTAYEKPGKSSMPTLLRIDDKSREGLFNLIKRIPPTLKYETGVILAGGDFVIVHGRFSGFGAPVNWIAAGYRSSPRRDAHRALGRDSGRGHAGTVKERLADVRRQVSAMTR